MNLFSASLLAWFDKYGRKDLPWQQPRNAYRVWVSEIMLQQTQVKTVIPYFSRFMSRFPDIEALALATEDEVLALWSGLGYYTRARNMHKTAVVVQRDWGGKFSDDIQQLVKLPGIGASTAAAIASLAFNKPTAILDGNVKRVLSRYFLIGGLSDKAPTKQLLWERAQECMPLQRCADYTQAIMDLGATCCTLKNPDCNGCPLRLNCLANLNHEVAKYPHKKTPKSIPTKHQQFLLLHTSDLSIYLEKRPSSGLWGGLWCLPAIDKDSCPSFYAYNTYQLDVAAPKPVLTFKHSFTHFHLQIKALSLLVKTPTNGQEAVNGQWFSPHELTKLGLAKPVQKILDSFLSLS